MRKTGQMSFIVFFSGTGTTYDHIVNLTTLGFDGRWKEKMVDKIPAASTRIFGPGLRHGHPHAQNSREVSFTRR